MTTLENFGSNNTEQPTSGANFGSMLNFFKNFLGGSEESTEAGGGNGDKVVQAAEARKGAPYEWGGQGEGGSDSGIDCSGLAVEATNDAGGQMEDMTASDILAQTEEVALGQAQPGDFVLWDDGKHIEIYKSGGAGGVQTIGSSSSRGGVSEGSMSLDGKTIRKNKWIQGPGGMV